MASGTIKAVASKAEINAIQTDLDSRVPSKITRLGTCYGASITIPNSGRHLFIITGAGVTRFVMLLVNVASNGGVAYVNMTENMAGEYAVITSASNAVTVSFTNTANGTSVTVSDFAMQGDLCTIEAVTTAPA